MRDLQPNLLDDFAYRVNKVIVEHESDPAFPKMDEGKVSREDLDDYLFDYQAVLDREGSARTQQTVYGVIAVIPLVVLNAFPAESLPWRSGMMTLMVALAIGIAIAAGIKAVQTAITRTKLRNIKAARPEVDAYINKVLEFEDRQQQNNP